MKRRRPSSTPSSPGGTARAAEIAFSNAAIADLEEIDAHGLAQFGEAVADVYMRGFEDAFAVLRDFPLAAPLRPEIGPEVRCLVHRQHRIFYAVSQGRVLVVRIVHAARDAAAVLKGDET